jgi:uncharacterized protein
MCIGCRGRTAPTELLRVVVQGKTLIPDPRGTLLGRGAYVHLTPKCLGAARSQWARALRVAGPLDASALPCGPSDAPASDVIATDRESAVRTSTR